jgi:hypothetical protein
MVQFVKDFTRERRLRREVSHGTSIGGMYRQWASNLKGANPAEMPSR